MSFKADVYRILIASPSDLEEERHIATESVHEWNAEHAVAESVVLLPVKWETHAMPQSGIRPQEAINRQLATKCDILVGMFWTKIGTSTGVAESGTVEEIDEFVADGKPALLYFSSRPVDPNKIDLSQQRKLKKFQADTYKKALTGRFNDLHELRQTLVRDFMRQVRALRLRQGESSEGPDKFEARLITLEHQIEELKAKSVESRVQNLPSDWLHHTDKNENSDPRAERTILGAILLDNRVILSRYVESLSPADFSLASHGLIFRRMVELAQSNREIDFITLTEQLSMHKELEAVGGVAYVTSLTDGIPLIRDIEPFVKIVNILSNARKHDGV